MKKLMLIILVLIGSKLVAEIIPNTPPMTLTDAEGVPLGVSDSISIHNAMGKLSKFPDGVYLLKRPDVTFTVKNNIPVLADEIVFQGFISVKEDEPSRVTYSWKQMQGRDVFLMPRESQMDFIFGFELPPGIKFNILAVENQEN